MGDFTHLFVSTPYSSTFIYLMFWRKIHGSCSSPTFFKMFPCSTICFHHFLKFYIFIFLVLYNQHLWTYLFLCAHSPFSFPNHEHTPTNPSPAKQAFESLSCETALWKVFCLFRVVYCPKAWEKAASISDYIFTLMEILSLDSPRTKASLVTNKKHTKLQPLKYLWENFSLSWNHVSWHMKHR